MIDASHAAVIDVSGSLRFDRVLRDHMHVGKRVVERTVYARVMMSVESCELSFKVSSYLSGLQLLLRQTD